MMLFSTFNINYKDIIQLDGAFYSSHLNYDSSPIFNRTDGKELSVNTQSIG